MADFETMMLPADAAYMAPDGTAVRPMLELGGGGLAHFELPPGRTSKCVVHNTVEEIWYIVGGGGEMWREQAGREAIVALGPGTCLTIPVGTRFQFRARGEAPLAMIGITMPPWPGADEAVAAEGVWVASSDGAGD